MALNNWKKVLLARYLGEFQPANKNTCTMRKSSEDIQFDLSTMGAISVSDITEEMVLHGYQIEIDEDAKPHWLMKREQSKLLE